VMGLVQLVLITPQDTRLGPGLLKIAEIGHRCFETNVADNC